MQVVFKKRFMIILDQQTIFSRLVLSCKLNINNEETGKFSFLEINPLLH